jgi:hypothetical protein
MIEVLKNYLDYFEHQYNINKKGDDKIKVVLFFGEKPSGYCVPQIMAYRNHPPYTEKEPEVEMANYLEIFIDGLCIWRRTWKGDADDMNIREMTHEIFMHGMMHSWDIIKNRDY